MALKALLRPLNSGEAGGVLFRVCSGVCLLLVVLFLWQPWGVSAGAQPDTLGVAPRLGQPPSWPERGLDVSVPADRQRLAADIDLAEKGWRDSEELQVVVSGKVYGMEPHEKPAKAKLHWVDHRPFGQRDSQTIIEDVLAVVDEAGNFQFRLDPRLWQLFRPYRLSIETESLGAFFRGLVTLDYSLDIKLPVSRLLKGVLKLRQATKIRNGQIVLIGCDRWDDGRTHFLARTDVSSEGGFEVWARVPSDLRWANVGIRSETLQCTEKVSLADLTSRTGATIDLDVREVQLLVRDAGGAVTDEASVQGWLQPTEGKAWITKGVAPHGQAYRMTVQPGHCQVCVALAGHLAEVIKFDIDPVGVSSVSPLVVDLRRLDRTDTVVGAVVDREGLPRPRVRVLCFPYVSKLKIAMPAMQSSYTDASGRFSVPRSGSRELLIVADDVLAGSLFAKVRGEFRGIEPVLVLPLIGQLRLSYRHWAGVVLVGSPKYLVCDKSGRDKSPLSSRFHRGVTELSIGAGGYRVFVSSGDGSSCGVADVEVEPDRPADACVTLNPCVTVNGRIITGTGKPLSGALVELRHETVPPDVVDAWFRTRTDAGGRFELRCLDLRTLEFAVSAGGKVVRFGDPKGGDVILQ